MYVKMEGDGDGCLVAKATERPGWFSRELQVLERKEKKQGSTDSLTADN